MEDLFLDNFYYNVDKVRRYTCYTSFRFNKERIEKVSDRFLELTGLTIEDIKNSEKIDITLEIVYKGSKIFLNFCASYNNYVSQIISIDRDTVYDLDSNIRKEYTKLISNWRDLLSMMDEEPFKIFHDLHLHPEKDKYKLQKDTQEILHLLSDKAKEIDNTLKNKIFFHNSPKPNQKVVKFSVLVRNTGFCREIDYNGKNYLGLSHMTEHLLYSKNDNNPISDDFENHIYSNAYTGEFYTEYFHKTSTLIDEGKSFLKNSRLLVENIFRKDISSKLFDVEKNVVIDEISTLKESDFPFIVENSHKRLFFNNLPYYSLKDIDIAQKDYTLDDVKRLINTKYNSNNVEFHIEGDIDSLPSDYKKVLSELYLKYVPSVEYEKMEKFDFKSTDDVFSDKDMIKLDIPENIEFFDLKDNMNSISFKYKSSGNYAIDESLSHILCNLIDEKFNYIRKELNKYNYASNIFGRFTDVHDVNFLDENPALSIYLCDVDEDKLYDIKDEVIKFINEFIKSTRDDQSKIDKIVNHLLISIYEHGNVDFGALSDPNQLYGRLENTITDYNLLKDTLGTIEFKGIIRYENK